MYDQLANFGASSVTIFLDACFTGIARSRDLNLIDTAPIIFDKSKYEEKISPYFLQRPIWKHLHRSLLKTRSF